MWINGALTFWNNDPGKQSSPGFHLPFQDAESPAETVPGSGCSLAVLCQGRAWPGPAAAREWGQGQGWGCDTAGDSFHSGAILGEQGSDKGWQSLMCPCQSPERSPCGEDTNPAEDKAKNSRAMGHSRFCL